MREFGMPERIRTDQRSTIRGRRPAGFVKLSLGWMKLGIVMSASSQAYLRKTEGTNGCIARLKRTPRSASAHRDRATEEGLIVSA